MSTRIRPTIVKIKGFRMVKMTANWVEKLERGKYMQKDPSTDELKD